MAKWSSSAQPSRSFPTARRLRSSFTLALTSPFQIVDVDHQGATGDVYVDGAKQ